MRLTEGDRNALACASVVPADQWIPLDIWELVIPVDICEIGDVHDEVCLHYFIYPMLFRFFKERYLVAPTTEGTS